MTFGALCSLEHGILQLTLPIQTKAHTLPMENFKKGDGIKYNPGQVCTGTRLPVDIYNFKCMYSINKYTLFYTQDVILECCHGIH